MKRLICMILTALMLLGAAAPALAEESAAAESAAMSAAEEPAAAESAIPEALEKCVALLKDNPRSLVYTEGTDARILETAVRLKKEGIIKPILIGNTDEIREAADQGGFDIEGLEIIDPASYPDMDRLVEEYTAIRSGKETADEARELLLQPNYFGTMLVKEGLADGLLGGATYSTADTVRPALRIVKPREGVTNVSSYMILIRGDEQLAMGDCAIIISYEDKVDDQGNVTVSAAQQVAEVAVETAHTASSIFGIDPRIAMLSFSTNGSAKGAGPTMMREAASIVKEAHPELACDGEMQFDAAYVPEVGQLKFPGSPVAGYANVFIFPDIESGNIGYKIAQRLGGFTAIGPILQGLNAPINDLSRGCNAEEVYLMSIITASQSIQK